jgi:hypothetical protein
VRWRVGAPAFVLGGAFLLMGAAFSARSVQFLRRAQGTEGTVVGWEAVPHDDGVAYYPTVRFVRANGQPYTFRGQSGGAAPGGLGQKLTVLYDPDDYTDARVQDIGSLWGGAMAGFGFAAVLIAVGVFVAWGSER